MRSRFWIMMGICLWQGMLLAPISLAAWKPPLAKIIVVKGKVEVRRIGHSQYRQVQVEEPLYHGDLIKVTQGGRGVVQCASDATIWTIPADGIPRGIANTCSPPPDS